jgi:hypothetical protein
MLVFISASIAAKARGIDISCGCFGHAGDRLSFAWHMVLDVGIIAAIICPWRDAAAIDTARRKPVS